MESLDELVGKYRTKGILPDTNLLVVFLIGTLGAGHLKDCRATKSFGAEDFALLDRFLGRFEHIITTPHVLTEVSNLTGSLRGPLLTEFRRLFQNFIATLGEEQAPAVQVSGHADFLRLGLTDAAISSVAPGRYLVLTDDLDLVVSLARRGVDAINFNYIRTGALIA